MVQQRYQHYPVLANLISIKLKEARMDADITLGEAAKQAKHSIGIVKKSEEGYSIPTLPVLLDLCDVYGIELSDIISLQEWRDMRDIGVQ